MEMKFLARLIFSFFSGLLALWAATYFIKGFAVSGDLKNFLTVAAIFTLINLFIRPILKLVLTPVIFLTFGLGIIVVNALTLYILDYFSQSVSIDGVSSLIYATLIISVVNIILHFSAKHISK
ncbi:MAG: phage holin family protein [Patescibacteria group bacterium]